MGMLRLRSNDRFAIVTAPLSMTRGNGISGTTEVVPFPAYDANLFFTRIFLTNPLPGS